ncbi:MAG: hypothetical protein IT378_01350 [Sandaracinaceae bacterium]|nr:hypothetical protein [Sandaracinaceae bacterium]
MSRGPYIVGRAYDWAFFLSPPLAALALGIAIAGGRLRESIVVAGQPTTLAGLAIGALIHAHLVAVLFRSHGNAAVFARHRFRFVVVPSLLWIGIVASPWMAVSATVVATFWDVYHSGAQTFGLGRIYDRNSGVREDKTMRWLDFALNQVLYAGPILAGAVLVDHVVVLEDFRELRDPVAIFLARAPAEVEGHRGTLAWVVLGAGTAFIAYYLFEVARRWRRGARPSLLKIFLVTTTGLTSLYTWGLDSWGEAFFIMNLFHAVQYLALVWATEQRSLLERTRLGRVRGGKVLLLVVYVGSVALYGLGVELMNPDWLALWGITIVVSLMHFWYDGFIWSVRKEQV